MPKIVYEWVAVSNRIECHWLLVNDNGEYMCGSFPKGYPDKQHARRALRAAMAIFGAAPLTAVDQYVTETGPGPKPT